MRVISPEIIEYSDKIAVIYDLRQARYESADVKLEGDILKIYLKSKDREVVRQFQIPERFGVIKDVKWTFVNGILDLQLIR